MEVSTEELCLPKEELRPIDHPYSDSLIAKEPIACYSIDEIVSEKLRALVQRSYTAPRDYYDLYYLTNDFTSKDWQSVKSLFLKKMEHKQILYSGVEQLVAKESVQKVRKTWKTSVAHQISNEINRTSDEMIDEVIKRIQENL